METGSRVAARMERLRGVERESVLRTSRGPVMSRSWKPGKRTMAMCFGGGDEVIVGWKCFWR